MKAEELRIGNWVTRRESEFGQVSIINGTFIDFGEYHDVVSELKPIPLDEHWLERMGFEDVSHLHVFRCWEEPNQLFELREDKGSVYLFHNYSFPHVEIKHVHQLQNLYYALTGTEIKIEP